MSASRRKRLLYARCYGQSILGVAPSLLKNSLDLKLLSLLQRRNSERRDPGERGKAQI